MPPFSTLRILFIDVEASGLGIGSWPVEVAWSWLDDAGDVRSDAILIRPDPDWPLEAWDPGAEELHGLTLDYLHQHGAPALTVARRVRGALASANAVSDSPGWDQAWLRVLLGLLPLPAPVIVRDIAWLEQQHQLSRAGSGLLRALWVSSGKAHRAGPDAEDLARAWQRTLEYEGEPRRS